MRKAVPLVLSLSLAAAGISALPAAADILVTREGARVETDGPWEVKGRLIVFTKPDGTLASIRTSEVDLEASEAATAEQAAPPSAEEQEEEAERKPVLVLTDEDVSQVDPEDYWEKPEGEAEAAEEAPAPTGLEVVEHEESDLPDGGVQVQGRLRNAGRDVATEVRVVVQLYDTENQLILSKLASLSSSALNPQQTMDFQASFPEVENFASVRFDIHQRPLRSSEAAAPAAAGTQPAAESASAEPPPAEDDGDG